MTTILPRRGTAAQWTAANPVLAMGEEGYETDTKKWKRGDGVTAWTALAYYQPAWSDITSKPTVIAAGADQAEARAAISAAEFAKNTAMSSSGRIITASDFGSVIEVNSTSRQIVLLPLSSSATVATDSVCDISRIGTGGVTVRPEWLNIVPNPVLRNNTSGGWAQRGTGATGQRVTSTSIAGATTAFRVSQPTSGSIYGFFSAGTSSAPISTYGLVEGDPVSAMVETNAPTSHKLGLRFLNNSGGTISQVYGPVSAGPTLIVENQPIPAGTTYIQAISEGTAATNGETADFTKLVIAPGATAPLTYKDPTTDSELAWDGTADASSYRGPVVVGGPQSIGPSGRLRVRKKQIGWVVESFVPDGLVKTTDVSPADRDLGFAGIVAPLFPAAGYSNVTLTANATYLARTCPSRETAVTMIVFKLITAAGTNDPVQVAIYDASLARLAVSSETTNVLNASVGTKAVTVPSYTLKAGTVYYLAISTGGTGGAVIGGVTVPSDIFGGSAPALLGMIKGSSYPPPATISSPTTVDTVPLLAARTS